jgi:hypothetical protein
MKAHRNILFLSFFSGLISLLFVIALAQSTKGFQIALAFMGSSFISFLLELPNFISLRKENFNRLYYSLYDIKANTSILKMNINNVLNSNIVTDKFYDQIVQNISNSTNNLRGFDPNYYLSKRQNALISGTINSICNAFNNVNQSSLKYTANYYRKRLDNTINEGQDRNITPNEMIEELTSIFDNAEALINLINTQAQYIFSKTQYKFWLIDDAIITNTNNNFKIAQK